MSKPKSINPTIFSIKFMDLYIFARFLTFSWNSWEIFFFRPHNNHLHLNLFATDDFGQPVYGYLCAFDAFT